MAEKGWTAQTAAAAAVAAGTGAAQLGLGYGLGVVVWPASKASTDSAWLGSLGWASWIAAGSTIFGAVAASRINPTAPRQRGPWRMALATSAAIGAMLTIALIAVPARTAVRADTFAPETIAAGYAAAGIVIGLVIAYWAVVSRAVAANLMLTAGWLWLLAVAAIMHSLITHVPLADAYLGGWHPHQNGTGFRYGPIYWPGAVLMLGAALLIGVLAVWPAVRRGDHGLGAAASGAVGPMLMALTFLILVPRMTSALGELESSYLMAPYAVLTGLGGSALMVALARQGAARRAGRIPVPSGDPPIDRPGPGRALPTADATVGSTTPAQPKDSTTPAQPKDQVTADLPTSATVPTQPGRSARSKSTPPRATPSKATPPRATPQKAMPAKSAPPSKTTSGKSAVSADSASADSASADSASADSASADGASKGSPVRDGSADVPAGSTETSSESAGASSESVEEAEPRRGGMLGWLRRGRQDAPRSEPTPEPAPINPPPPSSAAEPDPRPATVRGRARLPRARKKSDSTEKADGDAPGPADVTTATSGTKSGDSALPARTTAPSQRPSTVAAPPANPPVAQINPPTKATPPAKPMPSAQAVPTPAVPTPAVPTPAVPTPADTSATPQVGPPANLQPSIRASTPVPLNAPPQVSQPARLNAPPQVNPGAQVNPAPRDPAPLNPATSTAVPEPIRVAPEPARVVPEPSKLTARAAARAARAAGRAAPSSALSAAGPNRKGSRSRRSTGSAADPVDDDDSTAGARG